MPGLFNKVRNKLTGRRFLVSTIKLDDTTFETAVFQANVFFLPKGLRLKNPAFVRQTANPEEAEQLHQGLSRRLISELPERLFHEYAGR